MKIEFSSQKRHAFVLLDHQHGRRDVTCKLAIAYIFSQTERAVIGYFEVTGHLTMKLFPANSF